MDAAWALYEAWVAIQTGDVDSALIYGFGKSSLGDLHEIFTLQTDPYTVDAAVAVDWSTSPRCRPSALLDGRRARTSATSPRSRPRSRRDALGNPHAIRQEDVERRRAARPSRSPTRRCATPTSRRSPTVRRAIVIAADDVARAYCERPAWIRGIEHRIDAAALGVRDLTDGARRPGSPARRPAWPTGGFDVAEIHAQFSHEELILRDALGLGDDVDVNPSGGALGANPMMAAGLIRIGEVATRIIDRRGRPRASPTRRQGPCLQQNLVCVLEGRVMGAVAHRRHRGRSDPPRLGPARRVDRRARARGRASRRSRTPGWTGRRHRRRRDRQGARHVRGRRSCPSCTSPTRSARSASR